MEPILFYQRLSLLEITLKDKQTSFSSENVSSFKTIYLSYMYILYGPMDTQVHIRVKPRPWMKGGLLHANYDNPNIRSLNLLFPLYTHTSYSVTDMNIDSIN